MATMQDVLSQLYNQQTIIRERETDTDTNHIECTVNVDTRALTLNTSVIGVQSDRSIERVYFKSGRFTGDYIDLSNYVFKIHYVNANNQNGTYVVEDLVVGQTTMTWTWRLAPAVTAYAGDITFSVEAVRMLGDTVLREWNSAICEAEILESIETDDDDDDSETITDPSSLSTYLTQMDTRITEAKTIAQTAQTGLTGKLDKNQGATNSGKMFIVGTTGAVTLVDPEDVMDVEADSAAVSAASQAILANISTVATKVEATPKTGKIKIDGTEVQVVADNTVTDANYAHITVTSSSVSDGTTTLNKYVHPTDADNVATAAAVKVGSDAEGHVVIGTALTAEDIGAQEEITDGSAVIASLTDGVVTIKAGVTQTSGAIAQGTGADIVLKKVATTGKASDITIEDANEKITATTVEGALSEVVSSIGDDATATSVKGRIKSLEDGAGVKGSSSTITATTTWGALEELGGKITGVFHFRGEAEKTGSALYKDEEEITDAEIGDVYTVGQEEYAWTGEEWILLGLTTDLSNYYNKTQVDTKIGAVEADADTNLQSAKTYADGLINAVKGTNWQNTMTLAVLDGRLDDLEETIDTDGTGLADTVLAITASLANSGTVGARIVALEAMQHEHTNATIIDTITEAEWKNKINSVKIGDEVLDISEKTVVLPLATASKAGLVVGSSSDNQVSVGEDGKMTVNSLDVSKLYVSSGDTLVLNGGNA